MRHRVLALGRSGFGEAAVGLRLARELADAGDQVAIVIEPEAHPMFKHCGLPLHVLPHRGWGRSEPVIHGAMPNADTTVLADFVMAVTTLTARNVPPAFLHTLGSLVLVDTWHAQECKVLDAGPGEAFPFDPGFQQHPDRIVPVPFVRPDATGGFSILPEPVPRDGSRGKRVLLATSRWQHQIYPPGPIETYRQTLPAQLAALLEPLDLDLIHVGPQPMLPSARYLPALSAQEFRSLVASVDLVLSLNVAATTNTLAIACGTPVLTLEKPNESVMWPYGMWNTMSPLLADNPYGALLHRTDLNDSTAVRARIQTLLSDPPLEAMAAYCATVRALPSGATQIRARA